MRLLRAVYSLWAFLLLLVITQVAGPSQLPPGDQIARVRAYTRTIEFDYVTWTLDAVGVKFGQFALGTKDYLDTEGQHQLVLDYIDLVRQIQAGEATLTLIYADPNIDDPEAASAELRAQLEDYYRQRELLGPLAETVLQEQVNAIAAELGLTLGGQSIPPVLFHSTPLPWALIISPRQVIQQDSNISLQVDLTVEQHVVLEQAIEEGLDLSALVVPVGGIGVYPTMVGQTSSLNWLAEVICHEWTHNFLTLRPLGLQYDASPELRTINETVASIAGTEIGEALIEHFYPELAPPPPSTSSDEVQPSSVPAEPPAFDFRAEMHTTRITVDELLADGKIEEAETYMEARRLMFWEHGYRIRKLNQAYFAFYGAYADVPGGAAGEDPVGATVRELRAQSPDLATFVRRVAWVSSFEQLQALLTDVQSD